MKCILAKLTQLRGCSSWVLNFKPTINMTGTISLYCYDIWHGKLHCIILGSWRKMIGSNLIPIWGSWAYEMSNLWSLLSVKSIHLLCILTTSDMEDFVILIFAGWRKLISSNLIPIVGLWAKEMSNLWGPICKEALQWNWKAVRTTELSTLRYSWLEKLCN